MKSKRLFSCLLTIALLFSLCGFTCFAAPGSTNEQNHVQIETFDDGSYIVDELIIHEPEGLSTLASYKTKSATRTYTYYNAANKKAWTFSLTGTFKYNGSTSSATAASVSSETFVIGWKCDSKSASKSGATAKGTATFKNIVQTKNISIGLKCSANGTISNVNY